MAERQPIPTDPRFQDLTGRRYGRLVVEGFAGNTGKRPYWWCRCDCGTRKRVKGGPLKDGRTRSCGCLMREIAAEVNRTHGQTGQAEHRAWKSMLDRCLNRNATGYPRYGGRGVRVCERWRTFENFFRDMGRQPAPGYTLDRIDNEKGYGPDNCRWATVKEQARNRRSNVLLTFNGETRLVVEWAERTGLPQKTIYWRVRAGWPVERVLTEPNHDKLRRRSH